MRKFFPAFVLCSLVSVYAFAQQDTTKLGNPLIFVDSVRTEATSIEGMFSPEDIASISVLKGDAAYRMAGEEGKNGILLISTKKYAMTKAWKVFRSVSADYAKAVTDPMDPEVIYILNGEALTESYEDELSTLKKEWIKSIRVIDKKQLKKQFDQKGRVGVVLTTN